MVDKDLQALQAVRDAVGAAHQAQLVYAEFGQEKVDRICEAMVDAGWRNSRYLAELAVEETAMGKAESKHLKNFVGLRLTWDDIRDLKTCGVVRADHDRRVFEMVDPYGVIAAIVPTTNPTSTSLFKILIALKTRNAVVISPHPRAVRSCQESARILNEAAVRAGAPEGLIQCLTTVTLDATQALMKHPDVHLVLATGGAGLVKAAYSAGKPAYGVGPGNVPALIHPSADIEHAAACIVASQTFDNGTICSSEQSVVCEASIADQVLEAFRHQDCHIASPEECAKLEKIVTSGATMNPAVVGKFAWQIAEMAGFSVPRDTTVLVCPYDKVGPRHPLSYEILAPILSFYSERDADAARARCLELLEFEGLGHTFAIHTTDEAIVWDYAHRMPVYRFHVNAPTTQASVGFAVQIEPSLTLGCGSPGGNITGDNVTARHLLCTKRVAFIDPTFDADHIQPRMPGKGSDRARTSVGPQSEQIDRPIIRGLGASDPGGAQRSISSGPSLPARPRDAQFPVGNVIQVPSRPYLMDKYNNPNQEN